MTGTATRPARHGTGRTHVVIAEGHGWRLVWVRGRGYRALAMEREPCA